jgi:myo-inositol-1(or 4)-monophosphatase
VTTELVTLAVGAAHKAGALLLELFNRPPEGVATKSSPTDLVSDADRDSEALLLDVITSSRPHDGVLGEEGTSGGSRTGLRWVLDPLDGTVNFLFGIPVWSVSVAVQDSEGALVGVVYDPTRDETFTAARGGGAALNKNPIKVSDQTDLTKALVATGFHYGVAQREAQAEVVRRVLPRVRDIRRFGSAALDLCSTACGRVDAFYEAELEVWDRAAGELIVREAGGIVGDLTPPIGDSPGILASGPQLFPSVRKLVS